ncbi:MAG: glycosyltransferase family 4 protein [Deltaproteobacteria bacterium]|nr:glycosyltransferase family 4 protein [Deltaproteobacteria bacterium]
MKICLTGAYDPTYNRTSVILTGMRELGVEFAERPLKKVRAGELRALRGALSCDVLLLPSFTHKSVRKVRRAFPGVPVVFDPLISRYLTKVHDYKNIKWYSPHALTTYLSDVRIFHSADIVLADTRAHADYYRDHLRVPEHKLRVVPVGVDCRVFAPPPQHLAPRSRPLVGFYGSFNPLQGIDTIIKAAAIRRDCDFEIIGDGFVGDDIRRLVADLGVTNVQLTGWLPYQDLPQRIASYDIALGIFGTTAKAPLVIPNKIFHYAACGRPIITIDTPAIREVFRDDSNIKLIAPNACELASAIATLVADPRKLQTLSDGARELMVTRYDARHIAQMVVRACADARSQK